MEDIERKTVKITAQQNIIKGIQEAMKSNIYGIALLMKMDIETGCEADGYNYWIRFTIKDNETLTAKDWFWFGYFTREYID